MQNTATLLHPDGAAASLLSLSMAASTAMQVPASTPPAQPSISTSLTNPSLSHLSTSVGSTSPGVKQHRRLSSTGKARRRLSDARDAANRPSPAALQTAAALSLASLSLSTSPPLSVNAPASLTAAVANPTLSGLPQSLEANTLSQSLPSSTDSSTGATTTATPIPINGKHKKRGIDHKCESCSKIYRHPSCLIKHRWEHTPHWKEASKYVLSKHQQVQLLEAAAILSHLSPKAGTSLPEDRSLWPSFLSGGTLPPPEGATFSTTPGNPSNSSGVTVSSSVPAAAGLQSAYTRASSTGPRLHDFPVPGAATQLRPGLLGVSNSTSGATPSIPVPVPTNGENHTSFTGYRSTSQSWGVSSPYGIGITPSSYHSSTSAHYSLLHGSAISAASANSDAAGSLARGPGSGGWSLPHSSLRSVSGSSLSQSRSRSGSASASASGSRSDDDSLEVDVDVDIEADSYMSYVGVRGRPIGMGRWKREDVDGDEFGHGLSVREEDEDEHKHGHGHRRGVIGAGEGRKTLSDHPEEWDDMEMEMDMD